MRLEAVVVSVVSFYLLGLAGTKVFNEYRMTDAYVRQAVAQEQLVGMARFMLCAQNDAKAIHYHANGSTYILDCGDRWEKP